MAGKKGMKQTINKEDSKRHPEYYKKNFPELSIEECEKRAKFFRKSCNSGCIEYYIERFPNLSYNEQLQKLEEHKQKADSNNKLHFSYYETNFPELSEEEQRKLFHEYAITKNYQCKEYYLANGYSEEDAIMLAKENSKKAGKKISVKLLGELNPMHSSKTTKEKRNSISPRNIAFYERKYPELTHEEHVKLRKEFMQKNALAVKKAIKPNNIEYYLNQGMSEEEAYIKLKERQTTFTLEKCIQKYGEEIGNIKYVERQRKWLNTLYKNFQSNGDGRSKQSKFAKEIILQICNYFNISVPKNEYYLYDKEYKRAYAYDFCFNYHIIEFNGDYWHCNPNIFNENYINKVKQKTAKQIWEYDKQKQKLAENYKNKYLVIWESEYHNDKEKTIQKCIDFLKQ